MLRIGILSRIANHYARPQNLDSVGDSPRPPWNDADGGGNDYSNPVAENRRQRNDCGWCRARGVHNDFEPMAVLGFA